MLWEPDDDPGWETLDVVMGILAGIGFLAFLIGATWVAAQVGWIR